MEFLNKPIETFIIIVAITASTLWINIRFNRVLERSGEIKTITMITTKENIPKEIEEIKNLKHIYDLSESIEINERSKKLILDRIDWELFYVRSKVVRALGEDEYHKICGIKERNRK